MMSNAPQDNGDGNAHFRATMYQWSVRVSGIAFGMVVPAAIGVGLDRLCGTVVLFAILGAILGTVLGFWQLLKMAHADDGVDTCLKTRDNE